VTRGIHSELLAPDPRRDRECEASSRRPRSQVCVRAPGAQNFLVSRALDVHECPLMPQHEVAARCLVDAVIYVQTQEDRD
jgi:hypothetical protein